MQRFASSEVFRGTVSFLTPSVELPCEMPMFEGFYPIRFMRKARPEISYCNRCFSTGHLAAQCAGQQLCGRCLKPGHMAKTCTEDAVECVLCGSPFHESFKCPSRRRAAIPYSRRAAPPPPPSRSSQSAYPKLSHRPPATQPVMQSRAARTSYAAAASEPPRGQAHPGDNSPVELLQAIQLAMQALAQAAAVLTRAAGPGAAARTGSTRHEGSQVAFGSPVNPLKAGTSPVNPNPRFAQRGPVLPPVMAHSKRGGGFTEQQINHSARRPR
jgi:hypothetical protein